MIKKGINWVLIPWTVLRNNYSIYAITTYGDHLLRIDLNEKSIHTVGCLRNCHCYSSDFRVAICQDTRIILVSASLKRVILFNTLNNEIEQIEIESKRRLDMLYVVDSRKDQVVFISDEGTRIELNIYEKTIKLIDGQLDRIKILKNTVCLTDKILFWSKEKKNLLLYDVINNDWEIKPGVENIQGGAVWNNEFYTCSDGNVFRVPINGLWSDKEFMFSIPVVEKNVYFITQNDVLYILPDRGCCYYMIDRSGKRTECIMDEINDGFLHQYIYAGEGTLIIKKYRKKDFFLNSDETYYYFDLNSKETIDFSEFNTDDDYKKFMEEAVYSLKNLYENHWYGFNEFINDVVEGKA